MTTDQAIAWAEKMTGRHGATALALVLDISQPAVSQWGGYPPCLRQYQLAKLSRGKLKVEESCRAGAV